MTLAANDATTPEADREACAELPGDVDSFDVFAAQDELRRREYAAHSFDNDDDTHHGEQHQ